MQMSTLTSVLVLLSPLLVNCDSALTLLPTNLTVVEGENANFTCSPLISQGSPVLNTIDPGQNTADQADSDRRLEIDIDVDGDGTNDDRIYTWLDATQDDNGRIFFCQIGNTMSNEATLFVNYGVTIDLNGGDEFTVLLGDDLVISFRVDGRPTPTLELTRDETTVVNSATRILRNTSFSITSIEVEDAGVYVLVATNDVNSSMASFDIVVRYAPIFEASDGSVSLRRGDSTTINCTANAFPSVQSTKLSRDDQDLELDMNNMYAIDDATGDDAGEYVCTAMNEVGTMTQTIVVEVGDVPGRVSNIEAKASDDDDGRITIEWEAADENGAEIIRYVVVVQYKENMIRKSVTTPSTTVTREELDISKEESEVVLSISVTAVNGVGEGNETKEEITVMLPVSTGETVSGSTLCQALLSVLLMMTCTAFVLP